MKNILNRLKKIYDILHFRSEHNKLLTYNSGDVKHLKQIEFHKNNCKNRWVFGGNRTGKTECGAVETIYFARGNHPYKKINKATDGWVVSISKQVQRDVAQKKILNYINPEWIVDIVMLSGKKDYPENGIIDYIKIKNVFNTISKIGFKSCDQGREKFQGTSLDYVWFDEEPPRDIYLECKMRVMDKSGYIFGTMTPLKGLTWVYDEIFLNASGDKETWYTQMSWEDNPFLNKSEIEHFESVLSSEDLDARKFGNFVGSEGLVYKEFNENVNVIEPFSVPVEWYDNMSIDPGLNNPLSCHWYAVDYDGNVYVIYEYFQKNKDIDYHTERIKEICNILNWKKDSNGGYGSLIDSAANQRTLNGVRSVAELFRDRKINVNSNVNKDLFAGISQVKSYLKNAKGESRLFIFKTCTNLIRELKTYFWGKGDNPIKKDDHCLDELRYYLMSKPLAKVKPMSEIERHKNKMIYRENFVQKNY